MEESNTLLRLEVLSRGSHMHTICNGVCENISLTCGRENCNADRLACLKRAEGVTGLEGHSTHHVIWEDGTRELMKPIMANGDEIRGWVAKRDNIVQFTHPITSMKVMAFKQNTPVRGWISWRVNIGQPFYRTRGDVWNEARMMNEDQEKVLRLLSADASDLWEHLSGMAEVMDKRILNPGHPNSEWPIGEIRHDEVPLNKFFEDFNPCERQYLEIPKDCKLRREMELEGRECSISTRERIKWALGLHTLWKIVKQWRKVHAMAEHKKYSPGGMGHKRAREDFEARADE